MDFQLLFFIFLIQKGEKNRSLKILTAEENHFSMSLISSWRQWL